MITCLQLTRQGLHKILRPTNDDHCMHRLRTGIQTSKTCYADSNMQNTAAQMNDIINSIRISRNSVQQRRSVSGHLFFKAIKTYSAQVVAALSASGIGRPAPMQQAKGPLNKMNGKQKPRQQSTDRRCCPTTPKPFPPHKPGSLTDKHFAGLIAVVETEQGHTNNRPWTEISCTKRKTGGTEKAAMRNETSNIMKTTARWRIRCSTSPGNRYGSRILRCKDYAKSPYSGPARQPVQNRSEKIRFSNEKNCKNHPTVKGAL